MSGVSTDRIMVSGQRGVQLLGLPSDFGRVMSASDSSSVHPHLNLLPDLSLHGSLWPFTKGPTSSKSNNAR